MSGPTPGPLRVTADGGAWSASHDGLGSSCYQAIRDANNTVVALVVAHSLDHRAELNTEDNARMFAAVPDIAAKSMAFTLLVERFIRSDFNIDLQVSEGDVAAAIYELRSLIARATGGAE